MYALSVRQPYAELIAGGRKSLEVRSWSTGYRGPLLIVAGLRRERGLAEEHGLDEALCPRGVAICIVDLVAIRAAADLGRSARRRACRAACVGELDDEAQLWELARPRRVAPVPVRGRLGMFPVAEDLRSRIG